MAFLLLQEGQYCLPNVKVNDNFNHRPSYQEGQFCDEPDLRLYDQLIEDNDE